MLGSPSDASGCSSHTSVCDCPAGKRRRGCPLNGITCTTPVLLGTVMVGHVWGVLLLSRLQPKVPDPSSGPSVNSTLLPALLEGIFEGTRQSKMNLVDVWALD